MTDLVSLGIGYPIGAKLSMTAGSMAAPPPRGALAQAWRGATRRAVVSRFASGFAQSTRPNPIPNNLILLIFLGSFGIFADQGANTPAAHADAHLLDLHLLVCIVDPFGC